MYLILTRARPFCLAVCALAYCNPNNDLTMFYKDRTLRRNTKKCWNIEQDLIFKFEATIFFEESKQKEQRYPFVTCVCLRDKYAPRGREHGNWFKKIVGKWEVAMWFVWELDCWECNQKATSARKGKNHGEEATFFLAWDQNQSYAGLCSCIIVKMWRVHCPYQKCMEKLISNVLKMHNSMRIGKFACIMTSKMEIRKWSWVKGSSQSTISFFTTTVA